MALSGMENYGGWPAPRSLDLASPWTPFANLFSSSYPKNSSDVAFIVYIRSSLTGRFFHYLKLTVAPPYSATSHRTAAWPTLFKQMDLIPSAWDPQARLLHMKIAHDWLNFAG